jgi:hypothetical protein
MSMDREAIEALRIMLTAHPVGHTLTEEDESMDGLYNELCDLALEGLAQPEGGAMTPSEASNKVLEIRDKTVMSKYASQAECKAARDALWEAACALRWAEQSTPQRQP